MIIYIYIYIYISLKDLLCLVENIIPWQSNRGECLWDLTKETGGECQFKLELLCI